MIASWSKTIQNALACGPRVLFLPTKQSARPIYSHDNATWKSSIGSASALPIIWTGLCAWCPSLVSPQVQNWPCWYSPSIQSRSPLDVPCHCSFTQPNSCGHSPFLKRTSSWMARLCQECCQPTLLVWKAIHLKLGDSMADLAAKKVDWWRQNEDNLPHWAGAAKMVLLVQPSSAAAGRAFSLLWAAFSDQQQAAFKIMWIPVWCFTTTIAETITLMCSSYITT